MLVTKHREHRRACAAGETAKCNTKVHHATAIKEATGSLPNQWNTPVLAPPKSHRAHRHVLNPDGKTYAHILHNREYTGVTPYGFLDHQSKVLVKNTTISTDDFLPELAAARVSCEPLANADGTAPDEHTHPFILHDDAGLVRNPVQLAAAFAPGTDLDLLRKRWAFNHSLVFGSETLTTLADFAAGTGCGEQIAFDEPYYHIIDAQWAGDAITLQLLPVGYADIHVAVDLRHYVNPDIEGELSNRTRDGVTLGDADALTAYYARRRELTATLTGSKSISVNWNDDTAAPAAKTTPLNIIGTTASPFVQCLNCYAYATAAVTININMCFEVGGGGSYYYFDSNTNYAAPSTLLTSSTYTVGSGAGGGAGGDCNTLGTVLPTSGWSAYAFQVGFSVEAYFTGAAGFGYNIVQSPVSGSSSTCTGTPATFSTEAEAEKCATTIVPWNTSPYTVTLSAAGLPVTLSIYMQLRAAGQVSGTYNGALSFGRSWSATTKLGGKIAMPKYYSLSYGDPSSSFSIGTAASNNVVVTPYRDFTTTNKLMPTQILPPTQISVTPEAYIYIDFKVAVWSALFT